MDDDLVIYQPYQSPKEGSNDTDLRFLKIAHPHLPKSLPDEDAEEIVIRPSLRALHDFNGYSCVFKPGDSPCYIIKSASSPPQVIDMAGGPVASSAPIHTSKCENGVVYIDEQVRGFCAPNPQTLTLPGSHTSCNATTKNAVHNRLGHSQDYIGLNSQRLDVPRTKARLRTRNITACPLQITRR